ncbi:hypothetical protein A2U01_0077710, partial [Trifolium medium]|nr:hypothetical protein [Trifolium medium]
STSCASRRHQKVKLPLHQYTASRANPSCAPRQGQKAKPPSQHELRVAPEAENGGIVAVWA